MSEAKIQREKKISECNAYKNGVSIHVGQAVLNTTFSNFQLINFASK